MANKLVAIFAAAMLVFAALAEADAGRKMLQVNRRTDTGAGIAASTATSANINKAIDNKTVPAPGTVAVTKPVATPKKTDKGTATQGTAEAVQGATSAQINKFASGQKPSPKPAVKASAVPGVIAAAPKGMQSGGTGQAQVVQAGTSAAIANAVNNMGRRL